MRTKISAAIQAAIMDGLPHKVSDLMPYLRRRVDPTSAVKAYWTRHKVKKGSLPPMDKQVEDGTKIILVGSLWHLEKSGAVVIERPEGWFEGSSFEQLTIYLSEEGRRVIWAPQTNIEKGRSTPVWMEIFFAKEAGWLNVELTIELGEFSGEGPPVKQSRVNFWRAAVKDDADEAEESEETADTAAE